MTKRPISRKRRVVRRRQQIVVAVLIFILSVVVVILLGRWPITGAQLRAFGWKGDTSFGTVYQLNHLLRTYHITSRSSLTMFFATAAAETDYGRLVLEEGGDAYYAANGYSADDRGAGYLQITHHDMQLAFLQQVNDNFDGTDTATHIAMTYPWESACWLWGQGKTAPAPNPNIYAKTKGNTVEVFLATQYGINGWTIEDDSLRAIVQGASYQVSEDGQAITVNGQTAPTPKNWCTRLACYEHAKTIWG